MQPSMSYTTSAALGNFNYVLVVQNKLVSSDLLTPAMPVALTPANQSVHIALLLGAALSSGLHASKRQ